MEKRLISEKLIKIAERLMVEAESNDHKRLVLMLREWAEEEGFQKECKVFDGERRPDVCLLNPPYLFIGDAKIANDTPSSFKTFWQISDYVRRFGELLRKREIKGGRIAIATDNRLSAGKWKTFLNKSATRERIYSQGGLAPDFKIKKIDDETWIVYW